MHVAFIKNFLAFMDKGRLGHIGRVMKKVEAQKLSVVSAGTDILKVYAKRMVHVALKPCRLHRLKEGNVSM